MITQTYNLNLIPDKVPVIVNCSQYDANSRTIDMVIYDGSTLYTIPSGTAATVRGTKQDNTGFEYPCTISGSKVSFDIQDQMTIFSGKVPCEIRLANNGIIGTCNFLLNVEETPLDPDVTISETDLPLLEEAEQNAIRAEQAADRAESLLDTKMDLVSSPTANHVLLTDGNGQAVDGGKALTDLQDKLTAGTGISISSGTIKNEFASLSNVNLDTVTYNFSGYVYGATNYPTGTNPAGLLISSSRIATGTSYRGLQFYSPYNANTLYMRSYNGSWTDWVELYSSGSLTAGRGINIADGTISNVFTSMSSVGSLDNIQYQYFGYVTGASNQPSGVSTSGMFAVFGSSWATAPHFVQFYCPYNANTMYMRLYNGSWTSWVQLLTTLNAEASYVKGDKITNSNSANNYFICVGQARTTTEVVFTIPLSKPVNASSISFSTLTINARTPDGTAIINNVNVASNSDYTISAKIGVGGINIQLTTPTISGHSGQPVTVLIGNMTGTFA